MDRWYLLFSAKPAVLRRLAAGLLGLALLGALAAWWSGNQLATAPYAAGDVSREKPLRAVHGLPVGAHYPAVQAGEERARLEADAAFHDFGRVPHTQPVTHTFVLYNRGSADLVIRRAYTTCECTTAEVSGSIIPAGKAALVAVQYDPRLHSTPGTTLRRGVILETNDPDQGQVELWIQAEIR